MNKFLTIMCFALVATAAAESGFNYQQQKPFVKQTFRPSAPISNSGIYSVQQAPPLTSFNVQSHSQQIKQNYAASVPASGPVPQFAHQPIEVTAPPAQYSQKQFATPIQLYAHPAPQFSGQAPQYVAPVQQQALYAPTTAVASSSQFNYQPQHKTIVSKDIYIHSAPEEIEEIGTDQGGEVGPLRKNYRIVFIKAPHQNLKLNTNFIKRAQAFNEEKTVIYVLSKKPDLANIHSQLSAVHTEQKAHKPEVYFIKYKTQEEANRAQQEIQAQYDALGGSTHISDEGIAPVTSVIGGGRVNLGSVGPSFASGSSNIPVFSSGSVNGPSIDGSSNFVQSASSNQPQFVQQPFQGSQGSASTLSFAVEDPNSKYLSV